MAASLFEYHRQLAERFSKLDSKPIWVSVFRALHNETIAQIRDNKLSFSIADLEENNYKNRYNDVRAYDHNRVIISPKPDNRKGYVNASPVKVPEANRNYILCQGPTVNTCGDFWEVVWEQNVQLIIMVNKLVEKNMPKCHQYYPTNEVRKVTYGCFEAQLVEEIDIHGFKDRKIKVTSMLSEESRIVRHIQFITWPDHDVPDDPNNFLKMVNYVKNLGFLTTKMDDPPVVVHCSAGIGRSGSFVMIDSILRMIELGVPVNTAIDINSLLLKLRQQRYGLVQTDGQYHFVWQAILLSLEQQLVAQNVAFKPVILESIPEPAVTVPPAADALSGPVPSNAVSVGSAPLDPVHSPNAATAVDKSKSNEAAPATSTSDEGVPEKHTDSKSPDVKKECTKRSSSSDVIADSLESTASKRKRLVEEMLRKSREAECQLANGSWSTKKLMATAAGAALLAICVGAMFGNSSSFGAKSLFGTTATATTTTTATASAEDIVVDGAPNETVQVLKFSPATTEKPLLASGSWDGMVRVWMINDNGQSEGKAQQEIPAPIMDIEWTEDGARLFIAAADKDVRLWDLATNQVAVVGTHDGPVKTCHWIKGNNYQCLMTGSYDKTLRFWDMRNLPQQTSLTNIQLPERVYAADVVYPMAAVALANRKIKIYNLENGPQEVKELESQLKMQIRTIAIFKDKDMRNPCGFATGTIEGRASVNYVEPVNPRDNFTFKCHRSPDLVNGYQEIYAVHGVAFHPTHGTLLTYGADGRYMMWDKDSRTKVKSSEQQPMPITACDIHCSGQIMAYALGYDWSKGHEGNTQPGSKILMHKCFEDMKPKRK